MQDQRAVGSDLKERVMKATHILDEMDNISDILEALLVKFHLEQKEIYAAFRDR